MKQLLRFCLMATAAIVLFSSCSKKGAEEAKYIPKDAAFVMSINLKAMNDTMEKAGMGFDSLLKKMMPPGSADASTVEKFNELKNAGIDWRKNIHMFSMQYSNVKGNITVMNVLGSLYDAEKFEAFFKKENLNGKIEKEKDFSYSVMGGNELIAWNKSHIIFSEYQLGNNNIYGGGSYGGASEVDRLNEVKKYFSLESSASLADVDAYTDLAKQDAHGFYWMNMHSLMELSKDIQVDGLKDLLKDCYATATFNFERGKIVSDSKMYMGKAMQDIMDKNESKPVDLSIIDKYPSKNINGFYALSLNPQMIEAILKQAKMYDLANSSLKDAGLQMQDITNALSGEAALILSDMGNVPTAVPGQPSFANWVVNIGVKDKAAMDKIINVGVQSGRIIRQGDYIMANPAMGSAGAITQKIKLTATNLFIASDSMLIENYIAGKGGALSEDLKKKFEGKTAAAYFNFNSLSLGNLGLGDNRTMGMVMSVISAFTSQFNEAIMTADKYDDGVMKGHAELTMKDNSQNSMVVIVRSIADMVTGFSQMGRGTGMDENQVPYGTDPMISIDTMAMPIPEE